MTCPEMTNPTGTDCRKHPRKDAYRNEPTYWFAVLEIARQRGDFKRADEAKHELHRLGVSVYYDTAGSKSNEDFLQVWEPRQGRTWRVVCPSLSNLVVFESCCKTDCERMLDWYERILRAYSNWKEKQNG